MANAIARITKLKQANLAGSEQHTDRSRTTPNADPDKQNFRLIDSSDALSLTDLVRSRIGHQPIRKNAVLCVEMLLTASPEYFDRMNQGRRENGRPIAWNSFSGRCRIG